MDVAQIANPLMTCGKILMEIMSSCVSQKETLAICLVMSKNYEEV